MLLALERWRSLDVQGSDLHIVHAQEALGNLLAFFKTVEQPPRF